MWAGWLEGLLLPVGLELLEIAPEVGDFLFVLDADKRHLGARDPRHRVDDVILEAGLAPGDLGLLVGLAVVVTVDGAGLAPVEAVQDRTDLVLGVLADRMAGQAFAERLSLAGGSASRATT